MSFRDILNDKDRQAFIKGSYGKRMGYGSKPALLVIDMVYRFVDPKYDKASGDMGWEAIKIIRQLIEIIREKSCPIIYTIPMPYTLRYIGYKFGISRKRPMVNEQIDDNRNEIVSEIGPEKKQDLVIYKSKASAFFETGLVSVLNYYGIDTLIVTGATTSGCIRATVVDGASYGYYVIIPEETVFDRAELSHKVNLLDMDMKYADVEPFDRVRKYLKKLRIR